MIDFGNVTPGNTVGTATSLEPGKTHTVHVDGPATVLVAAMVATRVVIKLEPAHGDAGTALLVAYADRTQRMSRARLTETGRYLVEVTNVDNGAADVHVTVEPE